MTTFWLKSERYSPIFCRLMARKKNGPPLTDIEIAEKSGALSPYQVQSLSKCVSWVGIDLPTMRAFLVGCGMDFENRSAMKRVNNYLRNKPTWKFLRTSPLWVTLYEPMIQRWRSNVGR